jgi:hypothetical protein
LPLQEENLTALHELVRIGGELLEGAEATEKWDLVKGLVPQPPEGSGIRFSRTDRPTSIKNEQTAKERSERQLRKAADAGKQAWPELWDKVLPKSLEDSLRQKRMVDDLKEHPRAVNAEEAVTLLQHQIALHNDYEKQMSDWNEAKIRGADEAMAKLLPQIAATRTEIRELYDLNKNVGTETARGLAARKILANHDYSLASMEQRLVVAKGGKELTNLEREKVAELHQRIQKAELALETHRGALSRAFGESRNKTQFLANRIRDFAWEDKDPYRAIAELPEASLSAIKHAWNAVREKVPGLELPEFDEAKLKQTLIEPEKAAGTEKLEAEVNNARTAFMREEDRKRLSEQGWFARTAHLAKSYRIASVISSPVIYGKLLSAAASRVVLTPVTEAAGSVLRELPGIRKIAELAPRHGSGMSIAAEAASIRGFFSYGLKDAWQTMQEGQQDLESIYGKQLPPSGGFGALKDFFKPESLGGKPMTEKVGDLLSLIPTSHGAFKAPVLRAEFERSAQLLTEHAIRNHVDTTDPWVQEGIRLQAYQESLRAIFKQDDKLVSRYQLMVHRLEASKNVSDQALGLLINEVIPIVRIPTNIVKETLENIIGPLAHPHVVERLIQNGTQDMTTEDAETFMRSLKSVSVGLPALIFIGYSFPEMFGGIYHKDRDRDASLPKFGAARIKSQDIPQEVLHSPLMNAIAVGATIGQEVQEHPEAGKISATIPALLGLADEVPMFNIVDTAEKITDPYQRGKWWDQFRGQLIAPQALTWTAKFFDKDADGNTIVRDPHGLAETLQASIPRHGIGLIPGREDLPEK